MGVIDRWRGARQERAGFALYTRAVAAARAPIFYTALGVPDTLDGRFDMIGVYAFLVIRRLRALPPPGPSLAQAVFDAMFSDMDVNLREMGVGDLSVGKRVRTMWEAFHGRAAAYQSAFESDDPPASLAAALTRNVWRGVAPPSSASALASIVRIADEALAARELAQLGRGEINFPTPVPAAADPRASELL